MESQLWVQSTYSRLLSTHSHTRASAVIDAGAEASQIRLWLHVRRRHSG